MTDGKYWSILFVALYILLGAGSSSATNEVTLTTEADNGTATDTISTIPQETTVPLQDSTTDSSTKSSPKVTTSTLHESTTASSTKSSKPTTHKPPKVSTAATTTASYTTASRATTSTTPVPGDKFSVKWFFVGVASCLGAIIIITLVIFVVRKKLLRSREDDQPLLNA